MRGLILGVTLLGATILYGQHNTTCSHASHSIVFPDISFTRGTISFEEAVVTASTAFEELEGIKITVKRKSINTMMAARPKSNFLFRGRKKREYVIIISDKPSMNADALYQHMSQCAQVGVIGHELSHIVSYTKMSTIEMIFFGIKYYFKKKEILPLIQRN